MRRDTAILAGGCYWGTQELMRHQTGVISTRVGYCGGETRTPPTTTTAVMPRRWR
jgi:peptide methionine sulfoxide reductase MsrA